MKIFEKEQQIVPVWIALKLFHALINRSPPILVFQEDFAETIRKELCHFRQCQPCTGLGGTFHLEAVAIEEMVFLQGLNDEIVHWKPNRSPPIGIASE